MPTALAFRYARALADVVLRTGADPEQVCTELETISQSLAAVPALRTALESPSIPRARKRAVLEKLPALTGSPLVRQFLRVVMDHRRIPLLDDIREALRAVLDERLGIVRAEVASALPLGEAQQAGILDALSRLTGRQARARFVIREQLIGGAVARLGSTVYDGSVEGQLQALRHKLAGVEA